MDIEVRIANATQRENDPSEQTSSQRIENHNTKNHERQPLVYAPPLHKQGDFCHHSGGNSKRATYQ
jgi:hypothetical protein